VAKFLTNNEKLNIKNQNQKLDYKYEDKNDNKLRCKQCKQCSIFCCWKQKIWLVTIK